MSAVHVIQHKIMGLVKVSESFLIDGGGLVLIDTGHSKGCSSNVIKSLTKLGREPDEIELCILTHRHWIT